MHINVCVHLHTHTTSTVSFRISLDNQSPFPPLTVGESWPCTQTRVSAFCFSSHILSQSWTPASPLALLDCFWVWSTHYHSRQPLGSSRKTCILGDFSRAPILLYSTPSLKHISFKRYRRVFSSHTLVPLPHLFQGHYEEVGQFHQTPSRSEMGLFFLEHSGPLLRGFYEVMGYQSLLELVEFTLSPHQR